jgi:putative membrane protein
LKDEAAIVYAQAGGAIAQRFGGETMELAQIIPFADTWGMDGDVGAGWMIAMMIVMVLFWGAIIFGVVWLIRGAFGGRSQERRESPIEVLERRFAEGAISVEDYRARRKVLVNGTAEANGAHDEEAPAAPRAGGGSQS